MSKVSKWFKISVHTGWKKIMGMEKRRDLALDAHGGDELATTRALQALANVTKDAETKKKAGADARYFFKLARI